METLYDIFMTGQTEEAHDVKTKEGRKQLVENRWMLLAFFAYHEYLLSGRGAVIIQGDENEIGGVRYDLLDNLDNEELEQCVKDYDPEHEIVCVFELKPFRIFFDRYESKDPDQTPPKVYWDVSKRYLPTG